MKMFSKRPLNKNKIQLVISISIFSDIEGLRIAYLHGRPQEGRGGGVGLPPGTQLNFCS